MLNAVKDIVDSTATTDEGSHKNSSVGGNNGPPTTGYTQSANPRAMKTSNSSGSIHGDATGSNPSYKSGGHKEAIKHSGSAGDIYGGVASLAPPPTSMSQGMPLPPMQSQTQSQLNQKHPNAPPQQGAKDVAPPPRMNSHGSFPGPGPTSSKPHGASDIPGPSIGTHSTVANPPPTTQSTGSNTATQKPSSPSKSTTSATTTEAESSGKGLLGGVCRYTICYSILYLYYRYSSLHIIYCIYMSKLPMN
jgi:cell division septation protein DedD